jgi:nucleotide-binding universal stress UspA family protein
MKDSIVLLCDVRYFPKQVFYLAEEVAKSFHKPLCLLSLASDMKDLKDIEAIHLVWKQQNAQLFLTHCAMGSISALSIILSDMEAAMLFMPLIKNAHSYRIMPLLKACRDLRIPYIFVKEEIPALSLKRWLVPVSFLPEEKEKGVIALSFARFHGSSVDLLLAKDYGTRAAKNVDAIQTLLAKFSIPFHIVQGQTDSFSIQKEAVKRASEGEADGVILTASREYGIDDLIFGPPERKMITKSRVPLLFLNPRSDLYVLCG